MAAYFVTKQNRQILVRVGEHIVRPDVEEIVEVQLDGDELEYARNNFEGIPFHKTNRVQNWFGDTAKFIASNWGKY